MFVFPRIVTSFYFSTTTREVASGAVPVHLSLPLLAPVSIISDFSSIGAYERISRGTRA